MVIYNFDRRGGSKNRIPDPVFSNTGKKKLDPTSMNRGKVKTLKQSSFVMEIESWMEVPPPSLVIVLKVAEVSSV